MTKFSLIGMMTIGMILVSAGYALADEPIIYPKNGQTPQQQGQDANECRAWATQQTGVNPAYLQGELAGLQSQTSSLPKERPVLRGAARGVLAGAALGEINENMDDGAGKGAAMGVTAGAMRGAEQRIDMARQAQARQAQQQVQNLQNEYSKYNRAFSACMDAKGYSVN